MWVYSLKLHFGLDSVQANHTANLPNYTLLSLIAPCANFYTASPSLFTHGWAICLNLEWLYIPLYIFSLVLQREGEYGMEEKGGHKKLCY